MCAIIEIDGREVSEIGQLREFCPVLSMQEQYKDGGDMSDNDCLCAINIEETANKNGFECIPSAEQGLDFAFKRKGERQ